MPAYSNDAAETISSSLNALPGGTPVSGVARQLLELFTTGDLEPGTRLPPERQLSTRLGVGRSAVREALAALEILGIVDVRPGSGTYLRGSASSLLPETLRWGLMIGKQNTRQLIELREGLESYAARLAAERIEHKDLDVLAESIDSMQQSQADVAAFVGADSAFHDVLGRVAGNSMLLDLLQVSRSLLRVYNDRAVSETAQMQAAIDEHGAILEALRAHDGGAAATAMIDHMATARSRLLDEAAD
jgi:GntR family transcriptional repressor for pyruvate dehydrogenase complex